MRLKYQNHKLKYIKEQLIPKFSKYTLSIEIFPTIPSIEFYETKLD
ncbi:hypothetical protein GCM10022631_28050 [Deinococcus rubellus]